MTFVLLASAFAADPWTGTYSMDDYRVRFVDAAAGKQVELVMDGEVVMQGPLVGDGTARTAPLDSCGGSFSLEAGDLMIELDGPECAVEMNGLYQRVAATHCTAPGETAVFACDIVQKGTTKHLDVCKNKGGALSYRFGVVSRPELVLGDGKFAERALASGMEYGWTFTNEGYAYRAFVVESARAQDNGAGVVVSQGDKDLATLTCEDGWKRASAGQ